MKIYPTNSKGIKKAMKAYGITVLRCKSDRGGILVTVKPECKAAAARVLGSLGFTDGFGKSPKAIHTCEAYSDFPTLWRTTYDA